jgi:hypothetical protein
VNAAESVTVCPVSIADDVVDGVFTIRVGLTVTVAGEPLLLLPVWVESPLYVAIILAVPDTEGLNLTPQVAVDPVPTNAQLVTLKLPATPVSEKPTEPAGVVAPSVEVSVTFAVHVDAWLASMGLEHEIKMLVECLPGDNIEKPELVPCLLSPV